MTPQRGFKGFDLNPKGTECWQNAIGRMMLNFGVIEALSHFWIAEFAKDEALIDVALELSFGRRIKLLKQIIRRLDAPAELKQETQETWNRAGILFELRNKIAHNPIVYGWRGKKEDRAPDFIGVLDLKKRKGSIVPLVGLGRLTAAGDATVKVAQSLERLLNKFKTVSASELPI